MKLFLMIIAFLSTNLSASSSDHFELWAGLHSSIGIIPTNLTSEELKNPNIADNEKKTISLGISTALQYKNQNYALILKSLISVGQISDMSVQIEQYSYRGHASIRNFSLGPIYRHRILNDYFFEYGYFFSQQQMTLSKDKRLSFQSKGPLIGAGTFHADKILIELFYTFQKSYQYKYVDASDFSEAKTIYSRPTNIKAFHHLVGFNFEVLIF